jgi:hypothetical protein
MASPQLILELSKGFFHRNNPIDTLVTAVVGGIQNLVTYKSKMKLLKYKFMLAKQQMDIMESHIVNNAVEPRGGKIDRAF